MSVTKFIHIGYNKNFSTSLQRAYFDAHPEIYHLGAGYDDHNLGFIDRDVEIAIEQHWRYTKDFVYEDYKDNVKSHFQSHFDKAEKQDGIKAVGLSSEQMSFNLSPDAIDVTTKAKRLYDVFGDDTKILMIIRNQMDFFKSMYREAIRDGYAGTFNDYMTYVYKFQSRNFVPDYFYDCMYGLYAGLFGKGNIEVIMMEEVRNMETRKLKETENGKTYLLQRISDFLSVECPEGGLAHINPPLDQSVLVEKAEINRDKRYGLSNSIYNGCQMHRVRKYYEDVLKCPPPRGDDDWRTKWANIEAAQHQVELKGSQNNKIDYTCDPEIWDKLKALYAPRNKKFEELSGVEVSEYNYPM